MHQSGHAILVVTCNSHLNSRFTCLADVIFINKLHAQCMLILGIRIVMTCTLTCNFMVKMSGRVGGGVHVRPKPMAPCHLGDCVN